jgi:hypothetical protein
MAQVDVEHLIDEHYPTRGIWEVTTGLDLSQYESAIRTRRGDVGRAAWPPPHPGGPEPMCGGALNQPVRCNIQRFPADSILTIRASTKREPLGAGYFRSACKQSSPCWVALELRGADSPLVSRRLAYKCASARAIWRGRRRQRGASEKTPPATPIQTLSPPPAL